MSQSWNEQQLADQQDLLEFQRVYTIIEATEAICSAMDNAEVTRTELARRLGKTKGYITQLLSRANLTLSTISDVFSVLGFRATIQYVPLSVATGNGDSSAWIGGWHGSHTVIHSDAPDINDQKTRELLSLSLSPQAAS